MHHFPHLLKFDQITRHEKATAQNLIAFKCSTWPFIIVLKGEISYNDLTATMRTNNNYIDDDSGNHVINQRFSIPSRKACIYIFVRHIEPLGIVPAREKAKRP